MWFTTFTTASKEAAQNASQNYTCFMSQANIFFYMILAEGVCVLGICLRLITFLRLNWLLGIMCSVIWAAFKGAFTAAVNFSFFLFKIFLKNKKNVFKKLFCNFQFHFLNFDFFKTVRTPPDLHLIRAAWSSHLGRLYTEYVVVYFQNFYFFN